MWTNCKVCRIRQPRLFFGKGLNICKDCYPKIRKEKCHTPYLR